MELENSIATFLANSLRIFTAPDRAGKSRVHNSCTAFDQGKIFDFYPWVTFNLIGNLLLLVR
jgi:hypothetical protein